MAETDTPPRTGNQHSGLSISPYNAYEVNDGYAAIICITETHWENLAQLIGCENLVDDDRLSSKVKRANHREEVDGYIETWLDGQSKDEIVEALLDANVPCAPIRTIEELVDDPHLHHRGMLNHLENQSNGRDEISVPGLPIRFSGSDDPETVPAPQLGEHTDEVLTELLDYDADEI